MLMRQFWPLSYMRRRPALPPAADVIIAVQEFTAPTSTGNVDVTTAALGGKTPKAVILIMSRHAVANDPGESAIMSFSYGFSDASNAAAVSMKSQDNAASTNNATLADYGTGKVLGSVPNGTHTAGQYVLCSLSAFIADGATFNFTQAPEAVRCVAIFLAGDDLSAKVGEFNALGTVANTKTVNSLTFQPDLVLTLMQPYTVSGLLTNSSRIMIGACASDGTQACANWREEDNQAAGAPFQQVRNNKALSSINSSGSTEYGAIINNFTSVGFDIVTDASAQNHDLYFLALNFGGRAAKVVELSTPTSTGASSITGVGFEPQFALGVLTNLEAFGAAAGSTSDLQSGLGIAAIGNEQWAFAGRIDSGADPTDTACNLQSGALRGASATSTAAIVASLTSFDADGLTLNYSAVQANAKKGFMVVIE